MFSRTRLVLFAVATIAFAWSLSSNSQAQRPIQTRGYYVLGDVAKPGTVTTPLAKVPLADLVRESGGLTSTGWTNLRVIRKGEINDVTRFQAGSIPTGRLNAGDIVILSAENETTRESGRISFAIVSPRGAISIRSIKSGTATVADVARALKYTLDETTSVVPKMGRPQDQVASHVIQSGDVLVFPGVVSTKEETMDVPDALLPGKTPSSTEDMPSKVAAVEEPANPFAAAAQQAAQEARSTAAQLGNTANQLTQQVSDSTANPFEKLQNTATNAANNVRQQMPSLTANSSTPQVTAPAVEVKVPTVNSPQLNVNESTAAPTALPGSSKSTATNVNPFSNLQTQAQNATQNAVNSAKQTAGNLADSVKGGIANATQNAVGTVNNMVNPSNAGNAVGNLKEQATNAVNSLGQSVPANLTNSVKGSIANATENAVGTVNNMVNPSNAGNTVGNLKEQATNAVNSLGQSVPGNLTDSVSNVAGGISAAAGQAKNSATNMANQVQNGVGQFTNNVQNSLQNTIQNSTNAARNSVGNKLQDATTAVQNSVPSLNIGNDLSPQNALDRARDAAANMQKQATDAAANAIQSAEQSVQGAMPEMRTSSNSNDWSSSAPSLQLNHSDANSGQPATSAHYESNVQTASNSQGDNIVQTAGLKRVEEQPADMLKPANDSEFQVPADYWDQQTSKSTDDTATATAAPQDEDRERLGKFMLVLFGLATLTAVVVFATRRNERKHFREFATDMAGAGNGVVAGTQESVANMGERVSNFTRSTIDSAKESASNLVQGTKRTIRTPGGGVRLPETNRRSGTAVKAPKMRVPRPKTKKPVSNSLLSALPDLEVPDAEVPEVKVPTVKMPEVKLPEVKTPTVKLPEVNVPDTPHVKLADVDVDMDVSKVELPKIDLPEVDTQKIADAVQETVEQATDTVAEAPVELPQLSERAARIESLIGNRVSVDVNETTKPRKISLSSNPGGPRALRLDSQHALSGPHYSTASATDTDAEETPQQESKTISVGGNTARVDGAQTAPAKPQISQGDSAGVIDRALSSIQRTYE